MSLVELLVATMVTSAVSAGVLGTLRQAQRAFIAQSEAADVRQRLRVAVEALTRDLTMANGVTLTPGGITVVHGPLRHIYYRDAATSQLRHDDGQGTDLPVVDQVTALEFSEQRTGSGTSYVRVRITVGDVATELVVAARNMNTWP